MDKKAVGYLLKMAEGIMAGRFGEAAKFTQQERDLIEPSLAQILSSLSPSTAKSIALIANPAMLGMGIFLYAMRLSSLAKVDRPVPDGSAATPAPAGPAVYQTDRRVPQQQTVIPTNGTQRNAPASPDNDVGIVSGDLAAVWQ